MDGADGEDEVIGCCILLFMLSVASLLLDFWGVVVDEDRAEACRRRR